MVHVKALRWLEVVKVALVEAARAERPRPFYALAADVAETMRETFREFAQRHPGRPELPALVDVELQLDRLATALRTLAARR